MNFEFLTPNYVNTTTAIVITANTSSVSGLIDRKPDSVWSSDTQTARITMTLPSTQTVDRIVIQNTNMKQFSVYGNTTTAKFALTTSAGTSSTDYTGNSATNLYFILASGTSTDTVVIDCSTTSDAAVSKLGEVWVSSVIYQLDENPSHQYYKPLLKSKEIQHKMSDGGITLYRINTSYQGEISLRWQTQTVVDSLKSLYDRDDSFTISPFPKATVGSWNGEDLYLVNWIGDFMFKEAAGNVPETQGFNGKMKLVECPK